MVSEMDYNVSQQTGESVHNGQIRLAAPFKYLIDFEDESIDDLSVYFSKKLFQCGVHEYVEEDGTMQLSQELLLTISKA